MDVIDKNTKGAEKLNVFQELKINNDQDYLTTDFIDYEQYKTGQEAKINDDQDYLTTDFIGHEQSKTGQEVKTNDDQDYLTTDFIDHEDSQTGETFDDLATSPMSNQAGNPESDASNVLNDEDLTSFVDNPAYNTSRNSLYLSPVQYKLFTEKPEHTIDQTKPETPPPPLPPDRQPGETIYEEIPEYLELEEIPAQPAEQTPAIHTSSPPRSTKTTVFVVIGVLAGIITIAIAQVIINLHLTKIEDSVNLKNTTQPKGKFYLE